ncbi:PREDICTED: bromodomain-containing protein DDB_G0270170-like [Rhagoletis zephyria]|uniref:bromodomain-containing protein DDB_G0270170-like n=1 Tax=Rhagoletis zephyria TaxID=28612 RepID=UPI000811A3C2|nr:PREDICTED: bromodomain-containing protein DDB_G0270170-like [Rhagoletis zephyria]
MQIQQIKIQFVLLSSPSMSLSSVSLELWSSWSSIPTTTVAATAKLLLHKSQKKTFNKHKFKRIIQFTLINDMNMNMISNYYDSKAMTFNVGNNINNNNNTNNIDNYNNNNNNNYNNNITTKNKSQIFLINHNTFFTNKGQTLCVNNHTNTSKKSISMRKSSAITSLASTNAMLPYPRTSIESCVKASFPKQVAKSKIKDIDNMKTKKNSITTQTKTNQISTAFTTSSSPIFTAITPITSPLNTTTGEAAHRLACNSKLTFLLFSIIYYIYVFLNLYRHRKSFRRKSDLIAARAKNIAKQSSIARNHNIFAFNIRLYIL